jgi:hypothetical protein
MSPSQRADGHRTPLAQRVNRFHGGCRHLDHPVRHIPREPRPAFDSMKRLGSASVGTWQRLGRMSYGPLQAYGETLS